MLTAFHSAVINVRDFEVGVRDTARLLGLDPLRIEVDSEGGARAAIFGLANMALEIRAGDPSGTAAEAEASGRGFGQGAIRLACEASDPAAWLASRGLAVAHQGTRETRIDGGVGVRRFAFAEIDPAASRGIPVELIGDETIDPTPGPPLGSDEAGEVDPAARIRALDHVVVMSPAAEATRAFYDEGLGIRLALDKTFEKRGLRLLFFRIGGATIEIGGRLAAEARTDRSDRFGGLAWQVVDIDAIQARLLGEGFDVSEVRTGNKPGTRVCTVREPVHDVPTLLIEPVR